MLVQPRRWQCQSLRDFPGKQRQQRNPNSAWAAGNHEFVSTVERDRLPRHAQSTTDDRLIFSVVALGLMVSPFSLLPSLLLAALKNLGGGRCDLCAHRYHDNIGSAAARRARFASYGTHSATRRQVPEGKCCHLAFERGQM